MNQNKPDEAWNAIKAWYRDRTPQSSKPRYKAMKYIRNYFDSLYKKTNSSTTPKDLKFVQNLQFPVEDGNITWNEYLTAIDILKNGKAKGPSQWKAKDIKEWKSQFLIWDKKRDKWHEKLNAMQEMESEEQYCHIMTSLHQITKQMNSSLLMELYHHLDEIFSEGVIPRPMTRSIVVEIPKHNNRNSVRGIGIIDITWKIMAYIIKSRLQQAIKFHESLHGFRPQRGTTTSLVELKFGSRNNN